MKKRSSKKAKYTKPKLDKVSLDGLKKEVFSADEVVLRAAYGMDQWSEGESCCG